MGNNPIRYVDPDGRIERTANGSFVFYSSQEPHYEIGNSEEKIICQWGFVKANDGTFIEIRICLSDFTPEKFNCHGYTFLDGSAWLDCDQVSKILAGDNYIETKSPQPGGIFVQYDENGFAYHSGKIIGVEGDKDVFYTRETFGASMIKKLDGKFSKVAEKTRTIEEMGNIKFFINSGDKINEK